MDQSKIRNIAIIAHVDHGKTTLVDELFKYSGMFRNNQIVAERLMDSMDLEKERGITITSKNGSFLYHDWWINIVDTPGHADFGGQVERVLRMVDGVLLVVDAQEGPMPQTYFVLKKALALNLRVIVVINKIDKPAARVDWAVDQVFDLFVKLNAPDNLLDFPIVYASAKEGYGLEKMGDEAKDMGPVCEAIVKHIPAPVGDSDAPLQMLISSIDYSPYLGRLGIGKITQGRLSINKSVCVIMRDGTQLPARITKIYRFTTNAKIETPEAHVGEVVAVAGMNEVTVGVTYTDPDNPCPLAALEIDPPTISMTFAPNDSPFAGREGQYVTSRHIRERLFQEVLMDVALRVEPLSDTTGYKVSGRGELHLSILIEKMRREGYEFQVTRPQVIYHIDEKGNQLEPYEELTIDVEEAYMGGVIEKLGRRRGLVMQIENNNTGMVRMLYKIPTRGLLGFKNEFMTTTSGMGVMNYVFAEYGPYAGAIPNRMNGAMVAQEAGDTAGYSLFNLQDRGRLFVNPAVPVYQGMIIGEHCRNNNLMVNPCKGKKLTNMRASGSDENILLTPPTQLSLEDCIAYINDDEMVEITPKNIRLRKIDLKKKYT